MPKDRTMSRRAMLSAGASALPITARASEQQEAPARRGRRERTDVPAASNFVPLPVKYHFGSHYHDAITRAMEVLTEYADSGKTPEQTIVEVLGVLDHRDVIRALRARSMNECVPQEGMLVHEKLNDRWEVLDEGHAASMRREGERDAIQGIIDYDGLFYDGWLPAPAGRSG